MECKLQLGVGVALDIHQIQARVQSLRYHASTRDLRNGDVQMVRQGKISQVYPNFFPDGIDQNVVANFIDIVARLIRSYGTTASN